MSEMENAVIESLATEAGINDESLLVNLEEEERLKLSDDNPIKTTNSLWYKFFTGLINTYYLARLNAFKALIPQFFVNYATGVWLDYHAKDYGLGRDEGRKTTLQVNLVKLKKDSLFIESGVIFYVNESIPRKYQTIKDFEFSGGSGEEEEIVSIQVVAFDIGSKYNIQTGLLTSYESVITEIVRIDSTEVLEYGANEESDDSLRESILDQKRSNYALGVEDYYISILKNVPYVTNATLDTVDDVTGTMYFTIYGDDGLNQSDLESAQEEMEVRKMYTDKFVLSIAADQTLTVVVSLKGDFVESDVLLSCQFYAANMTKGKDWYAGGLMYQLQQFFAGIEEVEVSPFRQELEAGKEFEVVFEVVEL